MTHFKIVLLLNLLAAVAMCGLLTGTASAEDVTLTADLIVEDQPSCTQIGGRWEADGGTGLRCTLDAVDSLTVTEGVTLTFASLSIVSDAAIHIDGRLINNGSFTSTGTIDNGLLWGWNGPGYLINNGRFRNYGDLPESNRHENREPWTLELQNRRGGILENYGSIKVDTTTLFNEGRILNTGEIHTYAFCGGCPPSGISNAGTIESHGTITNDGMTSNWNDGVIVNFGVFANGPVVEDPRLMGGWFFNYGTFSNMCGASYTGNDPEENALDEALCCYLPLIAGESNSHVSSQ